MSPEPGGPYDLFISFHPSASQWVRGFLLAALSDSGLRVLSEGDFELGRPTLLQFEEAVRTSKRVLLVCTPAYMLGEAQEYLNLMATQYGLESATWPVVPLILQAVQLPPRLAILPALDATTPEAQAEALERLLRDLQRPLPPLSPRPPCPYPGMRPFQKADARYFYGRETEVQELQLRLRQHPFIAIIGPSGSGKSSLVFAGLLPALENSSLLGEGPWVLRDMRPGEQPLERLKESLNGLVDLERGARQDGEGSRMLLVVDQFEEIFGVGETLADHLPARRGARAEIPSPRAEFQSRLAALMGLPDFYLVITARADYYEDLIGSPLWPSIQAHNIVVLPLNESGLRQAIVRPAEKVDVYVESPLVERLVADAAGEPGVLPLVQETLVLLWDRLERRFLPLRAYDSLALLPHRRYIPPSQAGEPDYHVHTGLQVAIAYHADQVLAELDPAQQDTARRILLRLVQFNQGRPHTRRQQTEAQLQAAGPDSLTLRRTLDHLDANRLLILGGQESRPGRTVDIAHEALISGWDQLLEWIDQGRQGELARREVERAAVDWNDNARNASYLLRGKQLKRIQTDLALRQDELSDVARAFLRACQRQSNLMLLLQWGALALLLALALIPIYRQVRGARLRQAAASLRASFAAGPALLGDSRDADVAVYPARTLDLPAFAMDKYEVTYRQYRLCVAAGRCSRPVEPAGVEAFANAPEQWPVVWVDAFQAAAFCRWMGGRLPSEADWERAVRGGQGRPWPWGDQPPTPERVQVWIDGFPEEVSPTRLAEVDDPRFATGWTPPEEGELAHLLGNAAEWTRTPTACADPLECPDLWDGSSKVEALFVRGLGFRDQILPDDPAYSIFYRYPATPDFRDDQTGFRCVYPAP